MKNKQKIIILSSILVPASLSPLITITSCSTNANNSVFNTKYDGQEYIDIDKYANENKLSSKLNEYAVELGKSYSEEWYKTLSWHDWNYDSNYEPINLYCESEQQALALYANAYGDFWNVPLHENKEPPEKIMKTMDPKSLIFPSKELEIRGGDYKFLSDALNRSIIPENTIVYHGVEFMENEYYSQLGLDKMQKPDFSKCIGKTITSYGFLSTTLKKSHAVFWSKGENWLTGKYEPPFKEPFVFKIFIPRGTSGIAYISNFELMGTVNLESQFLINGMMNFKIINYYKENNINFFDVVIEQVN